MSFSPMISSPIKTNLIDARHAHQLRQVKMLQPTLIRVIQGHKQISKGQTHYTLKPNELLLWPAGHTLEITNIPDQGRYLAQSISFDPDFLNQFENHHRHLFNDSLHLPPNFLLPFNPSMERAWELSFTPLHPSPPADPLPMPLRAHYASEILICLLLAGVDIRHLWHAHHQTLSAQVQQLLFYHPGHEWTVEELAKQVHLGSSTLRRKLAAEHTSFRVLLEEVRLAAALERIQTSHQTISQISFYCGYASASHFSVRFCKRFGLTPRDLRSSMQKPVALLQ